MCSLLRRQKFLHLCSREEPIRKYPKELETHQDIFSNLLFYNYKKCVNFNQILIIISMFFFPQPTQVQNIQIPLLEEPLETEMLLEKLTNENIVGIECTLVFLDLLKVCKIHNIGCRHICILMRSVRIHEKRPSYYLLPKISCMLYDDFVKIAIISDLEMRNEFKQFPHNV